MTATEIHPTDDAPHPADSPPPYAAALPRVPPSNLRAEEAVLGAMLLARDAIEAVVETDLEPDHFYKPAHGHVFDAILGLYGAGQPVDVVTVAEELKKAGLLDEIGGPALLLEVQASTPAIGSAGHYAKIVFEAALLRRLITTSNDIAEMAYGAPDDVIKAVDEAEGMMFEVAQGRVTNTTAQVKDLLSASLDRLEKLYEQGESITGTATGYVDLDTLTAGFQPGALIVVGARPSMGKTAWSLGAAAHAALKDNKPCLFFTLEMSQLELSQRLLCSEALVDSSRIKTGRIQDPEWNRISQAVGRLAEAPLYIDDNPHTSVMEIRAKARRLKSRVGDLGMVVVDYIQLMTGRSDVESRQVEVSNISRGLKILARELECPVVALAQLNRQLEQRVDKRPMLSDLRESGAIEQDADVVLLLYRDEVYHSDTPDRGVAEVIVAKHRNGPTGTVKLAFRGQYTRFDNMARSVAAPPPPPPDEDFGQHPAEQGWDD